MRQTADQTSTPMQRRPLDDIFCAIAVETKKYIQVITAFLYLKFVNSGDLWMKTVYPKSPRTETESPVWLSNFGKKQVARRDATWSSGWERKRAGLLPRVMKWKPEE